MICKQARPSRPRRCKHQTLLRFILQVGWFAWWPRQRDKKPTPPRTCKRLVVSSGSIQIIPDSTHPSAISAVTLSDHPDFKRERRSRSHVHTPVGWVHGNSLGSSVFVRTPYRPGGSGHESSTSWLLRNEIGRAQDGVLAPGPLVRQPPWLVAQFGSRCTSSGETWTGLLGAYPTCRGKGTLRWVTLGSHVLLLAVEMWLVSAIRRVP